MDISLNIITIPAATSRSGSTYHYGSESNFQRFIGSYFTNKTPDPESTIIYKHMIIDVQYQTDALYSRTDGYAGCCWMVTVRDTEKDTTQFCHIRNWIDIVEYYNIKGLEYFME